MCVFWLEIEQCSIIGAGIWYQTNPVTDLHDTRTRNRRRKKTVQAINFMAPVSGASVMGIISLLMTLLADVVAIISRFVSIYN